MHVASAGTLDLIAPATPSGAPAAATPSDAASSAAAAFAALLNAVLAPTVPVAPPEPKAGDAATETPTDGTTEHGGDDAADGMHAGAGDVLRFKLMIHTARAEGEQPRATTLPVAPTSTDDAMGPGHTASAHGRGRGLAALVAGQKPGLARGRTRDDDAAADADATPTTDAGADASSGTPATPPSATPEGATAPSAMTPTPVLTPTNVTSDVKPAPETPATPAVASASATSALGGVDADLRARLTRVIDRMRDEHGHDVTVVEGYRSQARQDRLYEQGRTRPGAVVTWTQTSQHTSGRAVDVAIDGGWKDGPAFAQLQQIAREEGLRTLGARDPGHLELPRPDVSLPDGATVHGDASDTPRRNVGQDAGRVADVAAVARVADVAVVATPARVGTNDGAPSSANAGKQGIGAVAARAGGRGGKPRHESGADTQSGGDRRGAMAYAAATPAATSTEAATPIAAPARTAGVDAVDRVARALEIRETGAPRTMSTITLQLDNASGGQDRIRVGLRGIEVGTSIDLGDARAADQLRTNIGELRDALGRHGLTADTVQISGAARTLDVGDASRALSAAAGATRAEASSAGNGSASSQQQSQRDPSHQQTRDAQRDAQRDGQRDERRSRHGAQGRDDRQDPRSRSRRTR